jgi:glycerol uptake facilitator-like aquaporin
MKLTTPGYISEYLGTLFFILSILISKGNPFVIGGALALIIYMIANLSGGMVNPAVSLVMMMLNKITLQEFMIVVIMQLLGGISAYYAYKMLRV